MCKNFLKSPKKQLTKIKCVYIKYIHIPLHIYKKAIFKKSKIKSISFFLRYLYKKKIRHIKEKQLTKIIIY